MKVNTYLTDKEHLEHVLNTLNYEKVLNIIPCGEYDATQFMVRYRIDEENQGGTNNEQKRIY